ncbi:MAG: hypothetical protein HYY24_03250 [Verrucomicrobia bacterium]|nr:hypothetical protein [Verrucomicrobiota bacterium]
MAETTPPTPPPEPPPAPKPPRQPPGDTDKKVLADIKLGEDVTEAAQDPAHAADLAAKEQIDAATVAELVTLTKDARTLAGQVVTAKKARNTATETEEAALTTLMQSLRDIQQRAKRKFTDKPKRAAYCINKENFGRDREGLEQDAKNIIDLGEADALRGLTPEKITAARVALTAWKQADEDQGKAEEAQGRLLGQLQTKVGEVNVARREIQLTADTCWPHTDSANAPTRRAFKIPANKPIAR